MNGTIRCNKCHKAMKSPVCPNCYPAKGYSRVFILLYCAETKRHEKFRTDRDSFFLTYDRAERQLTMMRGDMDRGIFSIDNWLPGKIKARNFAAMFETFIQEKIEDADGNGKAPSTVKTYKAHYTNHLQPFLAQYDVRDVGCEKIKKFFKHLKDNKTVSVGYKQHVLDTLRTFIRWLYAEGTIQSIPPFPHFEVPKTRKIALDIDDQAIALENLPADIRDTFAFGMECGLRPGELAALKIRDLDFKHGILWVQRTYSACKLKESTKENSAQPIPLSDRAYEIAHKHAAGRFSDDFVFLNPNTGQGWTYNRLNKRWNQYSRIEAKLNEAIRHSYGTQIAEDGASPSQIQALMRHADQRSSEAYIHANVMKYKDIVNNRGRGRVVPMASRKSGSNPDRAANGQNS